MALICPDFCRFLMKLKPNSIINLFKLINSELIGRAYKLLTRPLLYHLDKVHCHSTEIAYSTRKCAYFADIRSRKFLID